MAYRDEDNRTAVNVRLPNATVERLDALRGRLSRASYIDALINGPPIEAAPLERAERALLPPTDTSHRDARLSPEEAREALDALRKPGETWGAFAKRYKLQPANVSVMRREGMTERMARRLGLEPATLTPETP